MRFCTECGNNLDVEAAAAPPPQAPARPAAAHPVGASAGAAVTGVVQAREPSGAEVAARLSQALGGPLCWRCRGVGDAGSDFCKFCGARYADAPARQGPDDLGSTASGPAQGDASSPAQAESAAVVGRLVSILKDGSDGSTYDLLGEQIDVGRTEGEVLLADDPYLSPRHARIRRRGDGFVVRDLDSVNGVYVRLRDAVELTDGDMILMGQQVLRFETLTDAEIPLGPASVRGVLLFGTPETPRFARLISYTTEGVGRDVHYLYRDETVLGRENGDIVFTDDPFLSRRHAAIAIDRSSGRFTLSDTGSSNGTCIRIRAEHGLKAGDQFRIGRHLFRFELPGGR